MLLLSYAVPSEVFKLKTGWLMVDAWNVPQLKVESRLKAAAQNPFQEDILGIKHHWAVL